MPNQENFPFFFTSDFLNSIRNYAIVPDKWELDKLILPRICGGVKAEDILFQKEKQGHAKGAKDLYRPVIPREAVQQAQTSGKSIAQVARELGISDTSIPQWRKELTDHGPEAFPGGSAMK